jgi:Lon protease-like protein
MNPSPPLPEKFEGPVPIFPLPNVVLFPNLVLPLHVFEPRYREMVCDALAGDRLIAMALLREGWEKDYAGNPPVYDVVCVGRIVQEHELPDGRFNFLLQGLRRGRIRRELSDSLGLPYRTVEVDLLPDLADDLDPAARDGWRQTLLDLLRSMLPQAPLPEEASLENCVNLLAAVALQDPKDQQAVLAADRVAERLRILSECLGRSRSLDRLAYGRPRAPDTPPSLN